MLFECFKILLIWIKYVSKLVSHKGVFKTIVLSFSNCVGIHPYYQYSQTQ